MVLIINGKNIIARQAIIYEFKVLTIHHAWAQIGLSDAFKLAN